MLTGIVLAALVARALIDFSTGLLPKVNGGYYPVQVRSLIATGRLAFPDLPLVFWLEAVLARLFCVFHPGARPSCILLACKWVDILLPALVAIPVFRVSLGWSHPGRPRLWPATVAALFSVLYLPALAMTADFQKNAVGMLWFAGFVWALQQTLKKRTWRAGAAAGLFFLLAATTHVGAFAVTLGFALLAVTAALLLVPRYRRRLLLGLLAAIPLLALVFGILHLATDPMRVGRLLDTLFFPRRLFERPVLFEWLRGRGGLSTPFDLPNLVVIHAVSLSGIRLLCRRWKEIEAPDRVVAVAALSLSLFLASPLLGQSSAPRLHLMAYLPAAFGLSFLITHLGRRGWARAVGAAVLLLSGVSALLTIPAASEASVSDAAYAELQSLREVITRPKETLVITRHGLEWWTAWALETHVAQDFGVKPEAWQKYRQVLFLKQFAGASRFGPGGPGGPPFREVRIPAGAAILFRGRYFLLAATDTAPPDYPLPRPR